MTKVGGLGSGNLVIANQNQLHIILIGLIEV